MNRIAAVRYIRRSFPFLACIRRVSSLKRLLLTKKESVPKNLDRALKLVEQYLTKKAPTKPIPKLKMRFAVREEAKPEEIESIT